MPPLQPALLKFWLRLELDTLRGVFRCPVRGDEDEAVVPNPRCLTRCSLAEVQADNGQWVVGTKSDGTRAVLVRCVFMRWPVLVSVDRSFAMSVHWTGPRTDAPSTLITVVDSERISDRFHAFDVFLLSRTNAVHTRPHAVRMDLLGAAVEECLHGTNAALVVTVKQFAPLSTESIRAALERDGDGLILVDTTRPVTFGSDPGILKWKAPHLSTVDLVVDRKRCGAHYSKLARVRTSDGKPTVIADVPLSDVPGPLPAIWEFAFDGARWRPVRRRDDKKRANSLYVVVQTMNNVVDVIDPSELLLALDKQPAERQPGGPRVLPVKAELLVHLVDDALPS
jgi:hypothetical protein